MGLLAWLRGKSPVEAITHTSRVDITLKCRQCGGTNFTAPSVKPLAHDKLTCVHCDTPIDLSAETRRIEDQVRAAFKARTDS
jgi:hypothetical protein